MLHCTRTDSANPAFQALVRELDRELARRDGAEHTFYAQFNKTDKINYALLAYEGETPVGCGAIRAFSPGAAEVKRMYVPEVYRGRGIASAMLSELEKWAGELGFGKCVLETGRRQPEAIALYLKCGYRVVPNFGPYEGVDNSVCFEKTII